MTCAKASGDGVINTIWAAMLLTGIIMSALQGDAIRDVTSVLFDQADAAVQFGLGLIGLLAFWSGIMRIAEEAGLTRLLSRIISPLTRILFPGIPKDHPAMGSVLLSMGANLLGLGNAATPLGIRAMEDLQKLNTKGEVASDAMCTFVAVTTSSLTLIPTVVLAMRATAGSSFPHAVVFPTLIATTVSTGVAIIVDRLLRNRGRS